ncbi:hypothetical protein [Cytobacillus sp. FSL H8-0458]|uniref:hypothetical protein n=1 Tax=Cytobacillus sp. FSL H8-0458 TaxID=2975346 RepID=UPI0030F5D2D1
MSNENHSKLYKWRAKYGAIVVAVSCLLSLTSSWGKNWILTGVFGLGVLLCGAIGFFDITRARADFTKK